MVPRAWCATASLPAKGVPRHQSAGLVRLHLARLAPFADCGVYACRSGGWIHLWFWENQRVRQFCHSNGIEHEGIALVPESVCLPKGRDGVVLHQCAEGVEAHLWEGGALLETAWWPQPLDAGGWQAWRLAACAAAPSRSATADWPSALPSAMARMASGVRRLPHLPHQLPTRLDDEPAVTLGKPWAANLLGGEWWRGLRLDPVALLAVAAALAVGMGGYWSAKLLALQREQAQLAGEGGVLSAQVDPLTQARGKALEDLRWTTAVSRLAGTERIGPTLDGLQDALAQQDAALRELEYIDGELRLLLVPLGGELNIVAVVQQLEAQPTLRNIRLLPESDARMMRVAAKIKPAPAKGN